MRDKIIAFYLIVVLSLGTIIYKLDNILLLIQLTVILVTVYFVMQDAALRVRVTNKYFYFPLILLVILFFSVTANTDQSKIGALISTSCNIFLLTLLMLHEIKSKELMINIFLYLTVLHGGLALLQFFFPSIFNGIFSSFMMIDPVKNYHLLSGRIPSIWEESPRLAAIMVALLPYSIFALFNNKKKYFAFFLICLIIFIIFLTATRIALLAALAVLYLFFKKNTKFKLLLLLLILAFFLLFIIPSFELFKVLSIDRLIDINLFEKDYSHNFSEYNRISILLDLFPKTFESPLWGMGLRFQKNLLSGYSSTHNSILQIVLTYGYPFMILLISAMLVAAKGITKFNEFENFDKFFRFTAIVSAISLFIMGIFHGFLTDIWFNLLFLFGIGVGLNRFTSIENKFIK